MVVAVHGSGLALDIVAAQPVFELLVNRRVVDALHEVVVGFALVRDYSQIVFRHFARWDRRSALCQRVSGSCRRRWFWLRPFLARRDPLPRSRYRAELHPNSPHVP
jgi:hypothetical protein